MKHNSVVINQSMSCL